jgi:short subunit dehydrogenase-like uncharacterized protein
MPENKILIYGANGYTGKLITAEAHKQNIDFIIAGRNEEAITPLAKQYNVPYEIISLDKQEQLRALLQKVGVVIHAAGPFSETSAPMIQACLDTKTHYLDITGEVWVFEAIQKQDTAAEEAGVTLIPGIGFDVVPTDCLSAFLKNQLPDATHLELAFVGANTAMSRGTAVTMAKNAPKGGFIREDGVLKNVPLAYDAKSIQFPHREQLCMTIPWGDLMTAYFNTGIPNIKVYSGVSRKMLKSFRRYRKLKFLLGIPFIQKMVRSNIEKKVTGPDQEKLENGITYLNGMVKNNKGQEYHAQLITPEAYKLTALTAIEAAKRLSADKNIVRGYATPSQAFGQDFILDFPKTERIDLGKSNKA